MSDRTALVVGGTSGIGLATARRLHTMGATVHIAGRGKERLDDVAASDPGLRGHQADGSDREEIMALAEEIGTIDWLIITLSGSEGPGPIADLDLGMLRRAFDAKFWGHITTLQAALPHLAPIRVNGVSPGLVDTPWWNGLPDDARQAYFTHAARALPGRRIATADDIADAVTLAATNPNLTGTIIETDGGARLVSMS